MSQLSRRLLGSQEGPCSVVLVHHRIFLKEEYVEEPQTREPVAEKNETKDLRNASMASYHYVSWSLTVNDKTQSRFT